MGLKELTMAMEKHGIKTTKKKEKKESLGRLKLRADQKFLKKDQKKFVEEHYPAIYAGDFALKLERAYEDIQKQKYFDNFENYIPVGFVREYLSGKAKNEKYSRQAIKKGSKK